MTRTIDFSLFVLLLVAVTPSTKAFSVLSSATSSLGSYSSLPSNPMAQQSRRADSKLYDSPVTKQGEETVFDVEETAAAQEETTTAPLTTNQENNTDNVFSSSWWKSLETTMGSSVDSSRILYPEINSGEVNRMFSSLEYCPESGEAQHDTGSVVGAAALVRIPKEEILQYIHLTIAPII